MNVFKFRLTGFSATGYASAVCLGVFAAAVSVAPMSAHANANWIGGSGGSEAEPYDIWDVANWDGAIGSGLLYLNVDAKTYINSERDEQIAGDLTPESGEFVFMGPLKFLCFKGGATGKTASIVKKGNWTLTSKYHFYAATGDNSKFALTNETGNVTIQSSSCLYVAAGANSEAEIVNLAGDWTVPSTTYIGRGSGSTGRFIHKGGTFTASSWLAVGGGGTGHLVVVGGEVKNTGNDLSIGDLSAGTMTIESGGRYTSSSKYGGLSTCVRVASNADGTLSVEGGEMYLGASAGALGFCMVSGYGADGRVSITDGGLVTVPLIKHGEGSGTGTLTIDNGTIKAFEDSASFISAHDKLFVYVGAGGAIFDANRHAITIGEPLLEDPESTGGGVTFKGGGIVTLAAGNTYTGMTTVEAGTALSVDTADFVAGGLAVALPADGSLVEGDYLLLTVRDDTTFDDGAIEGIALPERCRLRISQSGKSIYCIYGNPTATWIGGASGSLSDPAGWNTGVVPVGVSCFIRNETEATLMVGDTFNPGSITFPVDTARVTIEGAKAITGVVAIVNESPFHHEFRCPVVCAEGVTPNITRVADRYMTFSGGITMHDAPKTGGAVFDYWSGSVTLETESSQSYTTSGVKNYAWILPGSRFSFKEGCIDHMYVEAGATVTVERLVYNGCARNATANKQTGWFNLVFDNGNGVVRVGEVRSVGDAVMFHSYADADMVGGTIIADKLTCATTAKTGGAFPYPVFMLNCGGISGNAVAKDNFNGEGVWAIGPGGLSFPDSAIYAGAHFEISIGKSLGGRPAATLHSFADWSLQAHPNARSTMALQVGGNNGGFIVIDTGHYPVGDPAYDAATSHTVTLDGMVGGNGAVRVEGSGKVVFANEHNAFSGGLTVAGTATAEVLPGCRPGVGSVSVDAGATLEAAQSGTATLEDALTLAEGAALAFNFTELETPPVLSGTAVNFGTVNVKISASAEGIPKAASFTLTSGMDFTGANVNLVDAPRWVDSIYVRNGDIVLRVKKGTALFVR